MSESFEIRAAVEADLPDIAEINNWYILNTVCLPHLISTLTHANQVTH